MENPVLMNTWKNDIENVNITSIIDCLRSIEINVSNICNIKCPFCPQSLGWKNTSTRYMTIDTAKVIKRQLEEINYKGYICIAGFGEPTLNPNIKEIIKELKNFNVVLVSNGTLLSNKDWEEIENYSDTIQLKISVHEWDKIDAYRDKFKNTKSWFRNHDMKNPQMNLYNRAGYLQKTEQHLTRRCNYPFYKVFIDSNGDYLQCEADWNRQSKCQYNIFNTSIYEYYTKIVEERRKLMMTDIGRQNFKCCEICDIDGQMIGDNIVKWWDENVNKG